MGWEIGVLVCHIVTLGIATTSVGCDDKTLVTYSQLQQARVWWELCVFLRACVPGQQADMYTSAPSILPFFFFFLSSFCLFVFAYCMNTMYAPGTIYLSVCVSVACSLILFFCFCPGKHGIIASKRCDHVVIQDNKVDSSGGSGIMLHRSCDDSEISGERAQLCFILFFITRTNTNTHTPHYDDGRPGTNLEKVGWTHGPHRCT